MQVALNPLVGRTQSLKVGLRISFDISMSTHLQLFCESEITDVKLSQTSLASRKPKNQASPANRQEAPFKPHFPHTLIRPFFEWPHIYAVNVD
jgi:hypothetical protein